MNIILKKSSIILFVLTIMILFITACAPESKLNPPDTTIEQMQPVYGQSGVNIKLSGQDDKTPSEKLTYQYAFYMKNNTDGEETKAQEEDILFFEGTSEIGGVYLESKRFQEGEYLIKVAAVNEFGLVDETPAEGTFRVDLTPPQIPEIEYQIIAGEVLLQLSAEDVSDVAGYEMVLTNTVDSKAFSSTQNMFTFKANKGDHYDISVLAYDNAGNSSDKANLTIDTTVDQAPYLDSRLPDFLGANDTVVPLSFYDDWAKHDEITLQATFNGKKALLKEEGLEVDVSVMNEGTHTLAIRLEDNQENFREMSHDVFVDLTPPQIPSNCQVIEENGVYAINWNGQVEEGETFKVYGFNQEENKRLLDSVEENLYKTSERYLHYVITSVDKAGNESSPSYPLRTYNEQYRPVTSSDLGDIKENTLLTSLYSPYIVDKPVKIPSEILLGIEKGVELVLTETGCFEVAGQILSIPSKSSKERTITLAFGASENTQTDEPIIRIDGGAVWLNESQIIGDNTSRVLFEISNGGEFRAQQITISGVDTIINSVDSDTIVLDDSVINGGILAVGVSAKSFRLSHSQIKVDNGIDLTNIQQLELNRCVVEAVQTALNINGFTNAVINDSTLTGKNTLVINKLSAVDAKSVHISALENAIGLRGASTLNLREATISASKTALFVDRSAYLCAIESVIKDSEVGLHTLNPNIYVNQIIMSGNRYGITGKANPQWFETGIEFIGNEVDISD
ncbi:MAG TPA: hypothetical protein P5107_08545 [Thermotogota bacterium]|nr:hypothetical protein [Thermotogota bacterium]